MREQYISEEPINYQNNPEVLFEKPLSLDILGSMGDYSSQGSYGTHFIDINHTWEDLVDPRERLIFLLKEFKFDLKIFDIGSLKKFEDLFLDSSAELQEQFKNALLSQNVRQGLQVMNLLLKEGDINSAKDLLLLMSESVTVEAFDVLIDLIFKSNHVLGKIESNDQKDSDMGDFKNLINRHLLLFLQKSSLNIKKRFNESPSLENRISQQDVANEADGERLFVQSLCMILERASISKQTLNIKDMEGLSFQAKSAFRLSKDASVIKEIINIYRNNYTKAGYPEDFIEKLISNFMKGIRGLAQSTTYLLKEGSHIIGFNRFSRMKEKKTNRYYTYFGSFNINSSYAGMRLGEAVLKETLHNESLSPILADCDPLAPITKKYLEYGFVVYKSYEINGVGSLKIYKDDLYNEKLGTKSMSLDELNSLVKDVDKYISEGVIILPRLPEGQPNTDPLSDDYCITRYFRSQNGIGFFVYEKNKIKYPDTEELEPVPDWASQYISEINNAQATTGS